MYKLFARPGWGSVLVEAQLAWYDLPHQIEELDDLFVSAAARDTLRPVNPLAQVPTLVLPGGQVMTESAPSRCTWRTQPGAAIWYPSPAKRCARPSCAG